MYPHQADTVQINAPKYDLDIDGDNQPNHNNRCVPVSVQGTLNTSQESSILEDDNSTAPDNITTPQNLSQYFLYLLQLFLADRSIQHD